MIGDFPLEILWKYLNWKIFFQLDWFAYSKWMKTLLEESERDGIIVSDYVLKEIW